MTERIYLAANNPDLGGGERMLLQHAEALIALGHDVTVVSADSPREVLDAAAAVGAATVAIRAEGRGDYVRRLRVWDRTERHGVLWCHGLVPSFATTGHRDRIVHLHQDPRGRAQATATAIARVGARATLVPSADMSTRVRGSRPHPNWTADLPVLHRDLTRRRTTVGYLGRISTDKGVDVLARAVAGLDDVDLVIAGDSRYVAVSDVARVDAELDRLGSRLRRLGHAAPADLFRSADVVVFPSVWAEPFGLVVAEAMASGVPFVISDAGALPEVAGPDHPWVARSGDAADLAHVISAALTAPQDDVRAVTDRARRRWEAEYSPQAGRLRVRRLLEELAP